MAKFKVLITDHVFENFDRERSVLEPLGAELVIRQAENASELTPSNPGSVTKGQGG